MTLRDMSTKHLTLTLFTMFWTAQAISLFGDRLNNFSLVALINRFSDNPSLGLSKMYLAMYLPLFVLAPLIGVLLDRLNKRWVLVLTDAFRCLLVVSIPLSFKQTGSFLPVLSIVFLLSTANLFFLPAKSGLIPELVPRDRLIRVNSILWISGIVGVIGGFMGGGLIFDYFSWPACFYLDGGTYLLSALLLLGIALHGRREKVRPEKHAEKHPPFIEAIREGWNSIRSSPALLCPLGVQTLVFFGAGGFSVLAIALIKDASPPGSSLGISTVGLSIGLGMGIGSILVNRLSLTSRRGRGTESVLFLVLLPAAILFVTGRGLQSMGSGALLAGFSASPLIIIAESELQAGIDRRFRGRLFSFREILTKSFFLASAFIFTAISRVAHKDLLVVLLGLFLACAGIAWIILIGRNRTTSDDKRSSPGGKDADNGKDTERGFSPPVEHGAEDGDHSEVHGGAGRNHREVQRNI